MNRYVGFDNSSGIVLPIENRGFPDINISSNSSNKFAITELGAWNGLNGLSRTDVQRTTLGLQGQTNLAWSMLHLWDDAAGNVPPAVQRDWMNVGTSYSSNTDFMYSGIMERPVAGGGNLQSDAVMAWGRNNSLAEPDNMRFIFITPEQQGTAAGSEQGLEIMRLTPTGNVGIGNFTDTPFGIGGGYGQPQSPLDVQFQGAIPDGTNNIAVNVVNNTWDDPVPTEKIGINSESFANLEAGFVIGGKFLGVRGYKSAGVWAEGIGGSEGGNGQTYGLVASAVTNDFDARHYGVYASARFAVENIGIYAEGFSDNGMFAAGVHGHTQMQQNSWGGFFDGQTFCTLGTWSASDENIKEDVTEIENALDLILELNPKKYRFNQNVSELVLDDEYHYGFLAQELEEVIPEIVRDFVSPSRNDTSGNQIASSAEFKAVQYEGIIPILVEAFKIQNTTYAEQQELIQEQDSTIAALQNALATQTANIQNLQDQMENVLVQVDVMQQKTSNCCQSQDGSPTTPFM
ncbi:MAG: tail fiber domain-containing protein [Flavobacteriales bacterium]|nr:tail fiber domain-containing protein [Flavobacteriales bacterium]